MQGKATCRRYARSMLFVGRIVLGSGGQKSMKVLDVYYSGLKVLPEHLSSLNELMFCYTPI